MIALVKKRYISNNEKVSFCKHCSSVKLDGSANHRDKNVFEN